ncbi:MAG: signal peptidase I [Flavobacteriaceae bacterium]|nr:signal peptidase I [Flavobacteriaceae bacterium]|tara:strand:- start:13140 stop:14849 length:1710 start_codon:yes stop_codon:yes gene_type:complete
MNLTEWFIFFIGIQVLHFLGTWRLYISAGRKLWEASIPIYNAIVLMKIINRPTWWVILLFIPVINLIMIIIIWIETIRSFGKNSNTETALVVFSLGLYIIFLNYSQNIEYIKDRRLTSKTSFGEWMSSMMFAIIAATLVHTYFIQPFIIPTGSLEKSLLIGDFLFVSKFHYGARIPSTAISTPMVHDTLPIIRTRSYLKYPQFPYMRFPGFEKIKRNDIVVFNWPADTVRQFFVKEKGVRKPIDKKSNYVKRCIAIAGDTLQIKDGIVYINGQKNILPEWAKIQHTYIAYSSQGISSRKLIKLGFNDFNRVYKISNITQAKYRSLVPYIIGSKGNTVEDFVVITPSKGLSIDLVKRLDLKIAELKVQSKEINSTYEKIQILKKQDWIDSIKRNISFVKTPNENFFPNRITFDWNEDNFGPIVIPKKGARIKLERETYPLYKKVIEEYEKTKVIREPNVFKIDNRITDNYTFKQNYYWMMGDNRHRSEDSRVWGFVPEDHVMGKPVFIWMSIENFNDGIRNWKIRWDRVFSKVNGKGKRVSYLPHFIVFLILIQFYSYIRKKIKNKKSRI